MSPVRYWEVFSDHFHFAAQVSLPQIADDVEMSETAEAGGVALESRWMPHSVGEFAFGITAAKARRQPLRTDQPPNTRGTTPSSARPGQTRLSVSYIAGPTALPALRANARADQSANMLVLRRAMNATTTNPQSSVIQSPG